MIVAPFIKHAKDALLGAMILGAVFFAGEYLYERFSPNHWWVEYKGTSSTGRLIEGEIDMMSFSAYPRGGRVTWTDRLFCDLPPGEGFRLFSSFVDTASVKPDLDFSETPWLYKGATPREGSTCYMDSNILIKTPLGLSHEDNSISNTFIIGGQDATNTTTNQ